MKRKNWYRLDNAAKIFPAVYSEKRPYNFCFSAILEEEIKKEKLNEAINNILERVPTFKTKLKRGIFWYYLEENKSAFIAKEEIPDYLGLIDFKENNDYLFTVYYRENKVSIVAFHALSDGNGVLSFFKELLYEYAVITGKHIENNGMIKTRITPDNYKERDDNYISFCKKTKLKSSRIKNIAHSDGTPFSYKGFGIITASVGLDELKKIAKKYGATITEYITGLYLYYFYITYVKGKNTKKKNVVILVPVNLRKKFDSETLRNFSLFVRVMHDFKDELSLEECISLTVSQMKDGVKEEKLDALNYSNVKIEKNYLLKIVPLFLKDIVLRIGYYFAGENYQSGDISNVGLVNLPEDMKKFVKDMYFSISASYTSKQLIGVIGYNGKINITFTRNFVENYFEKYFLNELVKQGLDIVVESNYWEKKI